MIPWRSWLRAARPLAHANIAPSLVLGQALGFAATGRVSVAMAVVAHTLGVLDHLAIVFVNDLADEAGDRLHDAPTAFSGGSRVLIDGSLSRAHLAAAAKLAVGVFLALALGSAAVFGTWPLVPLALVALALLWLYSGPARRSHRGGGAVLQGLGIGVVLPLIGAAAQGSASALECVWLAPPLLLAVAGHWITSVPDEFADRRADKRTLAVVRGGLFTRRCALALVCVATLLGWLVLPGAVEVRTAVVALSLALSTPAWLVHRTAGPEARSRCLTFVVSLGAASSVATVGWSVAAILSRL